MDSENNSRNENFNERARDNNNPVRPEDNLGHHYNDHSSNDNHYHENHHLQKQQRDNLAHGDGHVENDNHFEAPQPVNAFQPVPTTPVGRGKNFNKYFLYTLVAGLIISAIISIVAVLVGKFDTTTSKALATTVSMVIHTFASLLIVSIDAKRTNKKDNIVFYVLLTLVAASFVTGVLGIWDVIGSPLLWDLYLLYFYTFLATLWIEVLLIIGRENSNEKATKIASFTSVVFTLVFYVCLIPTVFIHYPAVVPELVYRVLAASAIALATSSVITSIVHRVYLFRHPLESKNKAGSRWDIVMAIIIVIFGIPVTAGIMYAISMSQYREQQQKEFAQEQSIEQQTSPSTHTPATDEPKACNGINGIASDLEPGDSMQFIYYDEQQKNIVLGTGLYSSDNSTIHLQSAIYSVDKDCNRMDMRKIKSGDNVTPYYVNGGDSSTMVLIQAVD